MDATRGRIYGRMDEVSDLRADPAAAVFEPVLVLLDPARRQAVGLLRSKVNHFER